VNDRGNVARGIIYAGIIIGFVMVVIGKQQVIRANREQKIVSVISEWQTQGKPVVVRRVEQQDAHELLKITLIGESMTLEGDVPRAVWKRLMKGQPVFVGEEKIPSGRIADLAKTVDIETGLYHVIVSVGTLLENEERVLLAQISVDRLTDVILVADENISVEKASRFVWTVVDGKAHQVIVKTAQEGSYGVVIAEGLKAGDLLVVEGQSMLREGDKVNIREGGV